ncbi:MAG: hypothetical protein HFI40_12810 [Lachnospiraceae bacterium]|jgi:hypothetical protein|nr:hypothetical protein [Lachnospiraceae bacterium]
MWYNGTYACGHAGRVNIVGKSEDRQKKADKHFSSFCPECRQVERNEANREAAEVSEQMGLPMLSGSEKQVDWATTIRLEWIEQIEKEIEVAREMLSKPEAPKPAITPDEMEEILQSGIERHTEAGFWIDNKESVGLLLRRLISEYKESKTKAAS